MDSGLDFINYLKNLWKEEFITFVQREDSDQNLPKVHFPLKRSIEISGREKPEEKKREGNIYLSE